MYALILTKYEWSDIQMLGRLCSAEVDHHNPRLLMAGCASLHTASNLPPSGTYEEPKNWPVFLGLSEHDTGAWHCIDALLDMLNSLKRLFIK